MAIERDDTNAKLQRIRREGASESNAQVAGFIDEEGGQPQALSGNRLEGPFVAPVGDRPSRSDAYLYQIKVYPVIPATESTWDDVLAEEEAPPIIDTREWRTVVFRISYRPGSRNNQESPGLAFGRGLFQMQGALSHPDAGWVAPAVLDGSLFDVPLFGLAFRTVYPSNFITPTIPPTSVIALTGTQNFDLTFDVDPYNFVRLLTAEIIAEVENAPIVSAGHVQISYRLVR